MKVCLGNEQTPDMYIGHLVLVFREIRRVLRDDGTLWLNMGDSYSGYHGNSNAAIPTSSTNGWTNGYNENKRGDKKPKDVGLKQKDLMGIPWMLAFALREDGWYLRQDIIWEKPNPVPESCQDRCTRNHEYIFLLTKNDRYFYDRIAIAEPIQNPGKPRAFAKKGNEDRNDTGRIYDPEDSIGLRNKRSVWQVNLKSFSGAHYAVYPLELVMLPIKVSTAEKGCCEQCHKPWKRVIRKGIEGLPPVQSIIRNAVLLTPEDSAIVEYIEKNGGDYRISIEGDKHEEVWANQPIKGGRSGHYDKKGYSLLTWGVGFTSIWEKDCQCKTNITVPCLVLDPFSGSGTTGIGALSLNRNYLGIELNDTYYKESRQRLRQVDEMFISESQNIAKQYED